MPQFRSRDGRSTAILAVRMGKMPMLRSPKLRHRGNCLLRWRYHNLEGRISL
jgi:hypothetical protein